MSTMRLSHLLWLFMLWLNVDESLQQSEITCLRRDIPNADIVRIKDEYRFREQVNYVCKDGYEGSFTLTCRENGWAGNSHCREVTCNRKHYQNAEIIGRTKSLYKYDEQVEYVCKNGYEGRFSVTCGQNGWIGSLQCRECRKPKLPHGFIVGPYNDTLYYTCEGGYKLETTGWWSGAKCGDAEIEFVRCIEESSCGKLPVIPNMKVPPGRDDYGKDESVQIVCEEGYTAQIETLTCLEGKWNYDAESLKDICAPNVKPCGLPPRVENAVVETSPQKEYASGSDVTYRCRHHYTMKGNATITCNNGSWGEVTTACTQAGNPCGPPPDVENADIVTSARDEYSSGSEVTYSCRDNYTGRGQASITCTNGRWRWRGFSCSHTTATQEW